VEILPNQNLGYPDKKPNISRSQYIEKPPNIRKLQVRRWYHSNGKTFNVLKYGLKVSRCPV